MSVAARLLEAHKMREYEPRGTTAIEDEVHLHALQLVFGGHCAAGDALFLFRPLVNFVKLLFRADLAQRAQRAVRRSMLQELLHAWETLPHFC